jgi:hypothetical protein
LSTYFFSAGEESGDATPAVSTEKTDRQNRRLMLSSRISSP